jgi:hypothetical protein
MRGELMRQLVVLLGVLCFTSPAWCGDGASVDYDRASGTVSIEAAGSDIGEVLSEISFRTGVWILIDDGIEKKVTITLDNAPLEEVLHQLLRGLNYAMFYSTARGGESRLETVRVLSGEDVSGTSGFQRTRAPRAGTAGTAVPEHSEPSLSGGISDSFVGGASGSPGRTGEPRSPSSYGKYSPEAMKMIDEALSNSYSKDGDVQEPEEDGADDKGGRQNQSPPDGNIEEDVNATRQNLDNNALPIQHIEN